MTEVGNGLDGDWRIWQRLEDRGLCVIAGP